MITAERHHDISCGHRVHGHENKCAHLHGHNYRIHFTCAAEKLDTIGRVIDFGVIKSTLCEWLEQNWDHKFLYWRDDDLIQGLVVYSRIALSAAPEMFRSWACVPFNPTAENMASHLLLEIAPQLLRGTGVVCTAVRVEETRKCSARAALL